MNCFLKNMACSKDLFAHCNRLFAHRNRLGRVACCQSLNQTQDVSQSDLSSFNWSCSSNVNSQMTPTLVAGWPPLWATWFLLHLSLFLYKRGLEQQTPIVAINFRLVYGMGLLAHLLVNSGNRHHCPILLKRKTTWTQLHPAQPALWTTSMGLQSP